MRRRCLTAAAAAASLLRQQAALAAETGGEYLKYQDPAAAGSSLSWVSSLAYVASLLATFAFVLLLAYGASRFLGKRFGHGSAAEQARQQVLQVIPLGPQAAVQVVSVGGRLLVLGVTGQQIRLLSEITEPAEIERLKLAGQQASWDSGPQALPWGSLLGTPGERLERLKERFPRVFDQARK